MVVTRRGFMASGAVLIAGVLVVVPQGVASAQIGVYGQAIYGVDVYGNASPTPAATSTSTVTAVTTNTPTSTATATLTATVTPTQTVRPTRTPRNRNSRP